MAQSWFLGTNPLNQLGSTMGMGLPSAAQQQQSFEAAGAQAAAFFDEERRRWDDNYRQKQDQIDQQYELSKRSLKTAEAAQALDDWYKRESAGLARERLSQDKYEFDQTHDLNNRKFGQQQHEFAATLGQRQSEFDRSFGLDQGRLGYDVMNMGAQLRGPRNALQYQRLAQGVAANPNTATLFGQLNSNAGQGGFQAFGPGELEPMSLRAMYEDLTGSGGNSASGASNVADMERERQAVAHYAKNPHLRAAGTWEGWSDDKRDLFSSLAEGSGASMPTFLKGYQNAQVGQGFGTTRAA
jgi:hypothetical protein